jgi:hypothetical protein
MANGEDEGGWRRMRKGEKKSEEKGVADLCPFSSFIPSSFSFFLPSSLLLYSVAKSE